jgi:hypothetical protein
MAAITGNFVVIKSQEEDSGIVTSYLSSTSVQPKNSSGAVVINYITVTRRPTSGLVYPRMV